MNYLTFEIRTRSMDYKTYLLFTSDLGKAKEELKESKALLVIELTDRVLLVNVPKTADAKNYKYVTPEKPPHLDLISNLMVDVWSKRQPAAMQNLLDQILPNDAPKVTAIQNSELI